MERLDKVTCPYCGTSNYIIVRDEYKQQIEVICDIDEGGCGKRFVASIKVIIDAKGHKIQEEERKPKE